MWQLSANIHRNDVPQLDRVEQIAEWMELSGLQSAQVEPIESRRKDGRGHRAQGGINAAVRDLGIERNEAQRSTKIAGLDDAAKQAARDGLLLSRRQARSI